MNLGLRHFPAAEIGIFAIIFLVIVALGNYGKNTVLGFWGSILIAVFSTPLGAFLIISYFRWWRSSKRE